MCRVLDTIKWLFNKERRFLTTANGGIELSDDVIDLYGWLDLVYDRRTCILYCGMHKPYLIKFDGADRIKKILFDEHFRAKEDPTCDFHTLYWGEHDFMKTAEIFEAMGIIRLSEEQKLHHLLLQKSFWENKCSTDE